MGITGTALPPTFCYVRGLFHPVHQSSDYRDNSFLGRCYHRRANIHYRPPLVRPLSVSRWYPSPPLSSVLPRVCCYGSNVSPMVASSIVYIFFPPWHFCQDLSVVVMITSRSSCSVLGVVRDAVTSASNSLVIGVILTCPPIHVRTHFIDISGSIHAHSNRRCLIPIH